MTPRRLVLLSAVVIVLFAFILLFERKTPSTSERQSKGELHWDLPEERVEEIRLEQSGTVIELKKGEGETWRLVRPASYPADSVAVAELTRELGDLKRSGGGQAADARPEEYGLVPPVVKATVTWTEEKEPGKKQSRSIELGLDIPGTDVTAARLSGAPSVVFVPTSVGAAIKKSADDFKSKDVFGGSALDVSRLDAERGRGELVLVKKGSVWWLEKPLADLADSEAAERLVSALTGLRVLAFLPSSPGEDLAARGLDPPLHRVTLTATNGKKTTVDFGATRSDGNSVYARREGQDFTVESEIVEDLSKEAVALRSPSVLKFDRGDVSAVGGSFGGTSYALDREDGGWTLLGKPVIASAADDLLSAILDLKSRSFLGEADVRGLRSQEPTAKIFVTLSPRDRWEVSFWPMPGGIGAAVSRRPGAFLLPADAVGNLEATLRKAAASPVATPAATPKK